MQLYANSWIFLAQSNLQILYSTPRYRIQAMENVLDLMWSTKLYVCCHFGISTRKSEVYIFEGMNCFVSTYTRTLTVIFINFRFHVTGQRCGDTEYFTEHLQNEQSGYQS